MMEISKNAAGGWSAVVLLGAVTLGCGTTAALAYDKSTGAGGGGSTSSSGGAGGGGGSDCPGQCVPLGPGEWLGPMLLWIGKEGEAPECPPSAPIQGSPMFADLTAPNVCGTCECDAPAGSCALPTTLTAASSMCAGDGPGVPHTAFDAPAGWSGDCTAESPIPANQKCNGVNCVQSLTIAPLTLTEAPCGVSTTPVASKLPYTWGAVAQSCHGLTSGTCAAPSEICAPAVLPGFEQCLYQVGDRECPAAYSERHVFYYGVEDTRACTPCACGEPVGSTCTAFVSAFTDGSCSSPVVAGTVDASGPKCLDVLSGVALGSKLATAPVYAPGVCQASGGAAIGGAVPEEPSTFCCLPPGT
ncbi:MAG: hypothetical protein ACMG6S_31540 [Byssovorax sp.]